MECSTFFFGSAEELDRAVLLAQESGLGGSTFVPTPADPAIQIYAFSLERALSARAKELFISSDLPPIGFYDLPQEERRLPQEADDSSDTLPEEPPFVGAMWIAFVAQCYADPRKTRLIVHHDADVADLMPYLNAIMKPTQYNPGAPTLSYKKGVRMITLYPRKVAIAKADDLLDAWHCLKEIKDHIGHAHLKRNEITPDYHESVPPTPLDIYRLLPQTNCRRCEDSGCLAFAVRIVAGECGPDDCPLLKDSEYSERRFKLFELIGQSP
jgi:ArsR family metal-binding transcriptional regulator